MPIWAVTSPQASIPFSGEVECHLLLCVSGQPQTLAPLPCSGAPKLLSWARSSPDEMTVWSHNPRSREAARGVGSGWHGSEEICVPGFWSCLCHLGEALASH